MMKRLCVLLCLVLPGMGGTWADDATGRLATDIRTNLTNAQADLEKVRSHWAELVKSAGSAPALRQPAEDGMRSVEQALADVRAAIGALGQGQPEDRLLAAQEAYLQAVAARWALARSEVLLRTRLTQREHDRQVEELRKRLTAAVAAAAEDPGAIAAAKTQLEPLERALRGRTIESFMAGVDDLVARRRMLAQELFRWGEALGSAGRGDQVAEVREFLSAEFGLVADGDSDPSALIDTLPGGLQVLLPGIVQRGQRRVDLESVLGDLDASVDLSPADAYPPYAITPPSRPSRFIVGTVTVEPDPPWRKGAAWGELVDPSWDPSGRKTRFILVTGRGLLDQSGATPLAYVHDSTIEVEVVATAPAGQPPPEGRWQKVFRRAWTEAATGLKGPDVALFNRTLDKVLVLARLSDGVLAGPRTLGVRTPDGDLETDWILRNGHVMADLHFERPLPNGDRDTLLHAFPDDRVQLVATLNYEPRSVPLRQLTSLTAVIASFAESAEQPMATREVQLTRDDSDPRRYVSEVLRIQGPLTPGDVAIALPRGVHVLAAMEQHERVRTRTPASLDGASAPSEVFPRRIEEQEVPFAGRWGAALRRAIALDNLPASEPVANLLRRPVGEVNGVPITLGEHAAMLVLRDTFVVEMARARPALRDMLNLAERSAFVAWSLLEHLRPAEGRPSPLAHIHVPPPDEAGLTSVLPLPFTAVYDEAVLRNIASEEARGRWLVESVRHALRAYVGHVDGAYARALGVDDDDLEGLLELTGTGFGTVTRALTPLLVSRSGAGGKSGWDRDGIVRGYFDSVAGKGQEFRDVEEYEDARRDVVLTASGLPFVLGAEVLVLRVAAAGVALYYVADLATYALPRYLNRRADLQFAIGASLVLGGDRAVVAALREVTELEMLAELGGVGFALGTEFNALVAAAEPVVHAARLGRTLTGMEREGVAFYLGLSVTRRAEVARLMADAELARRSGRTLSKVQQRALRLGRRLAPELRLVREAQPHRLARQLRMAEFRTMGTLADPDEVGHLARATVRPPIPPQHYPNPLAGPQQITVRFPDGSVRTLEIHGIIGEGAHALVYGTTDPDIVLKFAHFPRSNLRFGTPEWRAKAVAAVEEQVRVSQWLTERGIPHKRLLAAHPDAEIPYVVQERLAPGEYMYEYPKEGVPRVRRAGSSGPGHRLPRDDFAAVCRLLKKSGVSPRFRHGLLVEDAHMENIFFRVDDAGRVEAGFLDLERIFPYDVNLDAMPDSVKNGIFLVETGKLNSAVRSVTESQPWDNWFARELLSPDADYFNMKVLEHKGYIRYDRDAGVWHGELGWLDIAEQYWPGFRTYIDPDYATLRSTWTGGH